MAHNALLTSLQLLFVLLYLRGDLFVFFSSTCFLRRLILILFKWWLKPRRRSKYRVSVVRALSTWNSLFVPPTLTLKKSCTYARVVNLTIKRRTPDRRRAERRVSESDPDIYDDPIMAEYSLAVLFTARDVARPAWCSEPAGEKERRCFWRDKILHIKQSFLPFGGSAAPSRRGRVARSRMMLQRIRATEETKAGIKFRLIVQSCNPTWYGCSDGRCSSGIKIAYRKICQHPALL